MEINANLQRLNILLALNERNIEFDSDFPNLGTALSNSTSRCKQKTLELLQNPHSQQSKDPACHRQGNPGCEYDTTSDHERREQPRSHLSANCRARKPVKRELFKDQGWLEQAIIFHDLASPVLGRDKVNLIIVTLWPLFTL